MTKDQQSKRKIENAIKKTRKAKQLYIKQQILLKESGLEQDDFWNIVFSDRPLMDELEALKIKLDIDWSDSIVI